MLWDVKPSVYYCSLWLCAGERTSTKEGEREGKEEKRRHLLL